jgi:hypothetical protein
MPSGEHPAPGVVSGYCRKIVSAGGQPGHAGRFDRIKALSLLNGSQVLPQQKSLVQWALRVLKSNEFHAFTQVLPIDNRTKNGMMIKP